MVALHVARSPLCDSVAPRSNTAQTGIFPAAAFFNHDCSPNMQRVVVQDMMFCRAAKDIAAGEELTDSYCVREGGSTEDQAMG